MRHWAAQRVLWITDDLRLNPQDRARRGEKMKRLRSRSGVVVEHSVDNGLGRLERESFDLLLVDERTERGALASRFEGDLGGWLRTAVAVTGHEDVPIIYVTSESPYGEADLASLTGVQGIVSKRGNVWQEIRAILDRLFTLPGLVDPEGKPLLRDSFAGHELVVKFGSAREKVLDVLARRPQLLRHLGDREFEELVAELFSRDGFEVELTSRSSDGGADIRAMRQTGLGKLLCLVECKRYKETNRVGPNLVRELRGVVDRDMATCGVLATTSSFTRGAYQEQRASPFRLFLKDLNEIAGWLNGKPVL